MNILIAVDPGDTTGWATFDYDTEEAIDEGSVFHTDMPEWLTDRVIFRPKVKKLIIEDFRLFKGKAIQQSGSTFIASQVIGMFKLWAYPDAISIRMQPPSIKPIAQRFTGRTPRGAHKLSHPIDAYNHGKYFFHERSNMAMNRKPS